MNWDDSISLWLLNIFGVLALFTMLLLGFIGALHPLIAAIRRLRDVWKDFQASGHG
ncbi:hypothetical protein ACH4E5_18840 [Streptomyces afghaniensis]|uniref:hypothetical protein n=1 Tax=Streptomyces afghaniensis TaxID=66865 RepID=UPI0037A396C0